MKEIISQIRKLEISTKQLVEGLIAGNYHSVFKGQGIEFSEIREYVPGDDIRSIDWKVTARFNQPFVKEYIEERDLNVIFFVDVSSSGNFGNLVSKKKKTAEIVASLMFTAAQNNDNVGLFLATDQVEKYVPSRKGRRHVFKALSALLSFKPESKKTDLAYSLSQVSKILKRRSIIFVISDFYSNEFTKPLRIMRNKHDIIAINILDEREQRIPNVGMIELEDEETGEQILVDTSDAAFRTRYEKLKDAEVARLRWSLSKLKIDFIKINTDEPYAVPLRRFFKLRKSRMVR